MKCLRCGGLMNFEIFTSASEGSMPWSYEGWRCVYCGEVVDPLVLLNRMKSKTLADTNDASMAGPKKGKGSL